VLGWRPAEQEAEVGVSNSASFSLLEPEAEESEEYETAPAQRLDPNKLRHYDGREYANKDEDDHKTAAQKAHGGYDPHGDKNETGVPDNRNNSRDKAAVKEEPAAIADDDLLEAADKAWLEKMPEASREEKKAKMVGFRRTHKEATDKRGQLAQEMTDKKAAFDIRKAQAEADVKRANELKAKIEGENKKLEEDRVKIVEQALKTARLSEDERITDGDNRLPNPGFRPKHLSETEEKINEKIDEAKAHDKA